MIPIYPNKKKIMINFHIIKISSWPIIFTILIFYNNHQNFFSNVLNILEIFKEENQTFVNYIEMLKIEC